MQEYQNSLNKRKEYLAQICKNNKSWKIRMFGHYVLVVIALIIIIGIAIMLVQHPLDVFGTFIFIAASVGFACIPYFISLSVKNTAKYKCAFPYSSFANGFLMLSDDKLEFVHWRVGKQEPAAYSSKRAVYKDEDKFVYTIMLKDMQTMKIDSLHICTITGSGVLSQPEWAGNSGNRENIETHKMSFLLDFEGSEVENNLRKWRKQNG